MAASDPSRSCKALFAHLSEYLDGELPEVECDKIERHCRSCARCRHVIGSLRRTIALCHESGRQTHTPPAVRAKALARVAALLKEDEAPAKRSPARARKTAARRRRKTR
ncbi:MAG TPA: zf-HC2 domain-containing protein [Vicinamibacterales bacterium]|nr:zf-HC2 domain-containing protein [Vicinamibacterales bacterium]